MKIICLIEVQCECEIWFSVDNDECYMIMLEVNVMNDGGYYVKCFITYTHKMNEQMKLIKM